MEKGGSEADLDRLGRRDLLRTAQQKYGGGKKERRREQGTRGENRKGQQWKRRGRGWDKGLGEGIRGTRAKTEKGK